jgi:hypothetical protein
LTRTLGPYAALLAEAVKLPRSEQEKIIALLDAFVDQHTKSKASPLVLSDLSLHDVLIKITLSNSDIELKLN